jgi:hypothetical protein
VKWKTGRAIVRRFVDINFKTVIDTVTTARIWRDFVS